MTHAKPDDKRAEFIVDQALEEKQIDPTLAIPADRIEWMQAAVRQGRRHSESRAGRLADRRQRARRRGQAGGEIARTGGGGSAYATKIL